MPKSLIDYPRYAELKERCDALKSKLVTLLDGDNPGTLRAEATAAEGEAMELEAVAMLDPKMESKAAKARKKAKELADIAEEKERQIHVVQIALQRIEPELAAAKAEASLKVIEVVRPEHEKLVPRIIGALRQLNAVLEEERELCSLLKREIGSTACITPVSWLLGAGNKWGKPDPGSEKDPGSKFNTILNRLRERGYGV